MKAEPSRWVAARKTASVANSPVRGGTALREQSAVNDEGWTKPEVLGAVDCQRQPWKGATASGRKWRQKA